MTVALGTVPDYGSGLDYSMSQSSERASRNRKLWRLVVAAIVCLLGARALALAAGARVATLKLDPAQTHISFTLPGNLHTTEGTFQLKSGVVRVEPNTGTAGGNVVVDAASGVTGISMRDAKLRNSVLEVDRFPEISFTPQSAIGGRTPDGAFEGDLRGILHLHGQDHPLSIHVHGQLSGDDLNAGADFTIRYAEWGVSNPSIALMIVSDTVGVEVKVTGKLQWSDAAGP